MKKLVARRSLAEVYGDQAVADVRHVTGEGDPVCQSQRMAQARDERAYTPVTERR